MKTDSETNRLWREKWSAEQKAAQERDAEWGKLDQFNGENEDPLDD